MPYLIKLRHTSAPVKLRDGVGHASPMRVVAADPVFFDNLPSGMPERGDGQVEVIACASRAEFKKLCAGMKGQLTEEAANAAARLARIREKQRRIYLGLGPDEPLPDDNDTAGAEPDAGEPPSEVPPTEDVIPAEEVGEA